MAYRVSTLGSAPSSSGTQLGSFISATMPASFGLNGGQSMFVTSLSLSPGIYIINYQVQVSMSGTSTFTGTSVFVNTSNVSPGINTSTVSCTNSNYNLTSSSNPFYYNTSTNLNVTSSNTYYLYIFSTFTGNAQYIQTNSFYNAMRIA